jgi:hypothetical protein
LNSGLAQDALTKDFLGENQSSAPKFTAIAGGKIENA